MLLEIDAEIGTPESKAIETILKVSDKIVKKINPDYGCENWVNTFDVSLASDYVVGLSSQEGGLSGVQKTEEE